MDALAASLHIDTASDWFGQFSFQVGRLRTYGVDLNPLALLAERAEMLGHRGWGSVSAGGSCRLLAAEDGWLAVNLPRDEDVAMVSALLGGVPVPEGQVWVVLAGELATRCAADVVAQAALLGMAVAEVDGPLPAAATPGPVGVARAAAAPVVADLSSLWAGPLCGHILALAGAQVLKVESVQRPDGSRAGTPKFFHHLNHNKHDVVVDLAHPQQLAEVVASADVVIEASRPRALEQLGIDAAEAVASGAIWCSITGWGRSGDGRNRVAFGDDAAAAAGLVAWHDETPQFVGDAIGDPITGVAAALACLDAIQQRRVQLLDIGMVRSVANLLPSGHNK